MLRTRVMPCLLLQGEGLVKTTNFKKPTYIGDAINSVRIYNQMEVDELILLDINATSENQPIQIELIKEVITECFMPICYGGGVRTIDDFKRLFYMGVEKVSVSSLLFSAPEVVKEAIAIYGAQSIIATLDVKLSKFRKNYTVYTHSGKKKIKRPLEAIINDVNEIGVGEIIINNIDREGTWTGFDNNLINFVSSLTNVPVVALGGAGSLMDVQGVVQKGHATAVALGSMAVFQSQGMGVLIKFPKIDELDKLLN